MEITCLLFQFAGPNVDIGNGPGSPEASYPILYAVILSDILKRAKHFNFTHQLDLKCNCVQASIRLYPPSGRYGRSLRELALSLSS